MHELPEQLDLAVTLDGEPFEGAWVHLRMPMERKNDYHLMVGPTDAEGALKVTRHEVKQQVRIVQSTGLMDYMGLGMWTGELVLRPFDPNAIRRAEAGERIWGAAVPDAYPWDFVVQMRSLAQRLGDRPNAVLEISAEAHGGGAQITCQAAST